MSKNSGKCHLQEFGISEDFCDKLIGKLKASRFTLQVEEDCKIM
jgi:hypothetical protein